VSGPGETSAFGLESNGEHAPTIPFIAHFAQSAQFDELFQDGMALVEATADYLDGEGRSAAKELKGALSVTYATESMRLTTRLLEVASWLVIQRALRDGEISAEEAESKRARVRLADDEPPEPYSPFRRTANRVAGADFAELHDHGPPRPDRQGDGAIGRGP
jgi:regulator of CtrA degradation